MFDDSFNFGQPEPDNENVIANTNENQNSFQQDSNVFFQDQKHEENSFEFGFGNSKPQNEDLNNFSGNKINENNQDKDKQQNFVYILEHIYNKQIQVNEENFYENESELVLNSYCLTSCKIDNAFLLLDMLMNKRNIQSKRRSFNSITKYCSAKASSEFGQIEDSLKKNQPDISEIIALNKINSAFLIMSKVIQPKTQDIKRDVFNNLYNFSLNEMFEQQLVKIKEAEKSSEYKLKEKQFKIIELEEQTIKLGNKLKNCAQQSSELTSELSLEENKTSSSNFKDKSLEIVLIDKETHKYKRENRDFKVKLEKKEKEVRKFMSEMNKILIQHDDIEATRRGINFDKIPVNDIEIRESERFNSNFSNR